MPQPIEREIESLFAHPDPQVRLFGLIQLENHLEELPYAEIERYLDRARREGDRALAEQARRLSHLVRIRKLSPFGEEAGWTLFKPVSPEVLARFPRLKGFDLEKLRGAAYDLLTPALIKVHSEAIKGDALPMERLIETLASLEVPQSLPVLNHIGQDPFLAEKVAVALSRYRTTEAEEYLLGFAADTSRPVSIKATELLGQTESVGVLLFLEKALADADARRRRAAAVALGNRRDARSGEWLVGMLADTSEEVVVAAIQSLARLRVARAADALIKLAKNAEVRIRATVASALARVQSSEAFDYLQLLLEDPDPRVKANALESLAFYQLSLEVATRLFVPYLKSEIPRLRGNAVLGYFRYRPAQAVESLGGMFRSPDRLMRRAAAFCAGHIQNADTAQWVTTMVLTEQTPEVLKSGMQALQRFSRKESVDIFMRMTTHPRVEVRVVAMRILGEVGGVVQIGALTNLYRKEAAPKVRSAIVTALAQLSGQNSLSILPPYLNDADDRVVANTIQGLHDVNNLEAITYLKPLVHHKSRRVRGNAMVSLFSLGEVKIIGDVVRMIDSRDPKDQASGLWALGAIGQDLRLGSLEERFVLCVALREYHRRTMDESMASGARLLESITHLKRPKLPESAPGSAPAPAEIDDGGGAAEDSDVVAELSAQGLTWEKFLDLSHRDGTLAAEALSAHTRANPTDEVAAYLYLQVLKAAESPALPEAVLEFSRKAMSYANLLYELARQLKEQGHMELSLSMYLQIFRSQYHHLDRLAALTQERAGEKLQLPATVLKLLSSFTGLIQGLDLDLGQFYLNEGMLEDAFHHLYRARIAEPDDSSITVKLAYVCRKLKAYQLGRELASRLIARLPADSKDRARATRILADIESREGEEPGQPG